ncbi:PRC-barrel domain-containing protein [Minwuia sp.]|uniref:PRC-barrel domain-containing protein n=1 Tax=Minwuia sp. TaxID=2493630 RepID=UPI003A91ECB3
MLRKTLITAPILLAMSGAALAADVKINNDTEAKAKVGTETQAGASEARQPGAKVDGDAGMSIDSSTGVDAQTENNSGAVPTETTEKMKNDTEGAVDSAVGTVGNTADSAVGAVGTTAASAANAVGSAAMNLEGEKIGEVVKLVETADGKLESVVVETSGLLLGIGGREVAIPAESVKLDGEATIITMTNAQIEALPDYKG